MRKCLSQRWTGIAREVQHLWSERAEISLLRRAGKGGLGWAMDGWLVAWCVSFFFQLWLPAVGSFPALEIDACASPRDQKYSAGNFYVMLGGRRGFGGLGRLATYLTVYLVERLDIWTSRY
jgi:hypothetical protein